jgi:hypothetical protein
MRLWTIADLGSGYTDADPDKADRMSRNIRASRRVEPDNSLHYEEKARARELELLTPEPQEDDRDPATIGREIADRITRRKYHR